MKITAPPAGARVRLDQINLADVNLYASGDAHLVWQTLRAQAPLFWQEHPGEGFWAVTRRADVRRVLAEHHTFSSEGGTALAMLGVPDPAAGLMMHSTDLPRHRHFREQMGRPFSPQAVPSYTPQVRALVREAISPALDGGTWDAAVALARLPMAVAAMLMGLPGRGRGPAAALSYAFRWHRSTSPVPHRVRAGVIRLYPLQDH